MCCFVDCYCLGPCPRTW